jgi:hypothetical protein
MERILELRRFLELRSFFGAGEVSFSDVSPPVKPVRLSQAQGENDSEESFPPKAKAEPWQAPKHNSISM